MEQWLQKLAGNEEKLLIRSPASNWLEDQLKSGDTVGFFKHSEWGSSGTRGLDRTKVDSDKEFPLKGISCIGNTMLPRNINYLHHPNHEGAKYKAMLSSSYDRRTESSSRPT